MQSNLSGYGLLLAILAYATWGCFPLFFTLLADVAAIEVLVSRIIGSLIATLLVIFLLQKQAELWRVLHDRKRLISLFFSSIFIAINWLIFIWAVQDNRVMETSLGYYMTPLVSLFLSRFFMKETFHPLQAIAGWLAGIAVVWEIFFLGHWPWVALGLAMSFGIYGLLRKTCKVDALTGLTVETLMLCPFALLWIVWQVVGLDRTLAFGQEMHTTLLLMASGVLTAIPLLLFAGAMQRLNLSIVGFIMYINPTLQFLIAVFVLDEVFMQQRYVTFGLIWIALVVFVWGAYRLNAKTLNV